MAAGILYPVRCTGYIPVEYTRYRVYLKKKHWENIPDGQGIYTLAIGYIYPFHRVYIPLTSGIYTLVIGYIYPCHRVYIPDDKGNIPVPSGIYTLFIGYKPHTRWPPGRGYCLVYPIYTLIIPEKYPKNTQKIPDKALGSPIRFGRPDRVYIGYVPGIFDNVATG